MPTYEYKCECEKCRHEWEEFHSMTREPTRTCPKCGRETARRLISGGGAFVLEGRGWARDGYASHS